jgi:hypothetical protein
VARVALLAAVLALLAPGTALASYPWPVQPFGEQHAIRANFADPRQEGPGAPFAFHSGIDVLAATGTKVYAVEPGVVHIGAFKVAVVNRGTIFGYWHILVNHNLRQGQWVHQFQYLGQVLNGWGHVHLSEQENGTYLNPLRPGGIAPYADTTKPVIHGAGFVGEGRALQRRGVSGVVDVWAGAYDTPPVPIASEYASAVVTPALVRWRVLRGGREVRPWTTAADFRQTVPPENEFRLLYAPGTRQNRPYSPGSYRFWLVHGWNTRALANGTYRLEVEASDTRGNAGRAGVWFTVAN